MGKPWKRERIVAPFERHSRRLKGLDEFERPEFVGRMARVERRRKSMWWAMLAGAVAIGAGIGWVLF